MCSYYKYLVGNKKRMLNSIGSTNKVDYVVFVHFVIVFQAAEQPQPDLGSTINALVSATPPNVALTRNDYHHLYHQPSEYCQP